MYKCKGKTGVCMFKKKSVCTLYYMYACVGGVRTGKTVFLFRFQVARTHTYRGGCTITHTHTHSSGCAYTYYITVERYCGERVDFRVARGADKRKGQRGRGVEKKSAEKTTAVNLYIVCAAKLFALIR